MMDDMRELPAEAERAQMLATTIAREAISDWLRARRKAAGRKAVGAYATDMAGTLLNLDPTLESAAVEELLRRDLVKGVPLTKAVLERTVLNEG
jgi:hypothetical protein